MFLLLIKFNLQTFNTWLMFAPADLICSIFPKLFKPQAGLEIHRQSTNNNFDFNKKLDRNISIENKYNRRIKYNTTKKQLFLFTFY